MNKWPKMWLIMQVWFKGVCYPNPDGFAAAGVCIKDGPEILLEEGFYIDAGEGMSCNVAECEGLIRALQFLKQKGFTDRKIVVKGDSELVIKQMSGKWKFEKYLYIEAVTRANVLAKEFTDLTFKCISRDENAICESLAANILKSVIRRHDLKIHKGSD